MKNKKWRILICMLLSMLSATGCGIQNEQYQINEEPTEAAIVEEYFHSDYTWTDINKSVNINYSNQEPGLEPTMRYGCIRIGLAPLFDRDDITRIEYYIEDGNGYFMDKNNFMIMKEAELEKRADSLTTREENGYHCTLDEQQDIYFTVYYKHDINLNRQQELLLKRNLMRKLSIVANLKFIDGTEEEHRYAFDFPYTYNFTNVNIYELAKK